MNILIAVEVGWKWMEINDGFIPGIRNNEERKIVREKYSLDRNGVSYFHKENKEYVIKQLIDY